MMTMLRIRLGALLLVFVSMGCTPRPESQSLPAPDTSARAAFDQYVDAFWSEGDVAAIERAMAPTMTYHYNGKAMPADYEMHRGALRTFREQFPRSEEQKSELQ